MIRIRIDPAHALYLQEAEHVGAWLQAERTRLDTRLRAFLAEAYGIAPETPVTLDTAAGLITIDDEMGIAHAKDAAAHD